MMRCTESIELEEEEEGGTINFGGERLKRCVKGEPQRHLSGHPKWTTLPAVLWQSEDRAGLERICFIKRESGGRRPRSITRTAVYVKLYGIGPPLMRECELGVCSPSFLQKVIARGRETGGGR